MSLLNNFWQLFLLSAPWLMLGLFIAGLLNVYLPVNFLNKHLGKEGFWTTVKAALIGAPMPLCSCGVIPAAIGLRRAGASKSATTAFLVSTPETGVDSVSVSYVLLGPFMAVIRPIAAICSAIAAGVLVGQDRKPKYKDTLTEHNHHSNHSISRVDSCCNHDQTAPAISACSQQAANIQPQASHCCDSKPLNTQNNGAISFAKIRRAIDFSCNKLLEDTMTWLIVGLFFAALVQTFVPESYLSQWGNGLLAMLIVVLISIPMYICATASTPIAAGLLLSGVSPGAVLVFMLAGPATNIATLGVVGKELGRRAVVAYLVAVIGVALIFGFLTDYLVAEFGFIVTPLIGEEHEVLPHWFSLICGIILATLIARLVIKLLRAKYNYTGKSIT